MIKEFLSAFSWLCHRQSQMGHVAMAHHFGLVLTLAKLSHLSSSLHLANTAFPQRYPFCPLPGMKVVNLTELSSQVCEGYALLQARAQPVAALSVKCAERREGRRLPDQNWNKSTDPLVQSFVKKLQRSQRSKIQQRHKWKELGGAELDQKLCSK